MKGLKADPFDFAFIFNIGGRTLCRKHPRYGFFCIQLERTLLLCASKIRLLPGVQDLFFNYYANPTWPRQLKQTSKRECHRGQRNHICKDSSLLLFHPPSIMAFAGGQCRWRMRWRTFDLIGDPFFLDRTELPKERNIIIFLKGSPLSRLRHSIHPSTKTTTTTRLFPDTATSSTYSKKKPK